MAGCRRCRRSRRALQAHPDQVCIGFKGGDFSVINIICARLSYNKLNTFTPTGQDGVTQAKDILNARSSLYASYQNANASTMSNLIDSNASRQPSMRSNFGGTRSVWVGLGREVIWGRGGCGMRVRGGAGTSLMDEGSQNEGTQFGAGISLGLG